MSARRIAMVPRAVLAVALFVVLGGPSPGAVGDCSSSTQVANAAQFCTDRDTWICARALASDCDVNMIEPYCDDGTMTMEEGAQCVTDAEERCAGNNWNVGCAPSQAEADSCIAALMDASRLGEADPPAGFPECTLCAPASSSPLVSGEEVEEVWSE